MCNLQFDKIQRPFRKKRFQFFFDLMEHYWLMENHPWSSMTHGYHAMTMVWLSARRTTSNGRLCPYWIFWAKVRANHENKRSKVLSHVHALFSRSWFVLLVLKFRCSQKTFVARTTWIAHTITRHQTKAIVIVGHFVRLSAASNCNSSFRDSNTISLFSDQEFWGQKNTRLKLKIKQKNLW